MTYSHRYYVKELLDRTHKIWYIFSCKIPLGIDVFALAYQFTFICHLSTISLELLCYL